jgi:uncharacterized membrane protein (UPF0182 family)
MQIEGIISQDTVISSQLNLLATGGNSQVVRGNMLTIPVEDSMLYVEPIYVRSVNANALPEVKKVIVYYKNNVVMENTLEEGLERIFKLSSNKPQPTEPGEVQEPSTGEQEDMLDLITRANTVFEQSQEAMRNGNWSEYGSKLKELEEILNKLNTMTSQSRKLENIEAVPAEQ